MVKTFECYIVGPCKHRTLRRLNVRLVHPEKHTIFFAMSNYCRDIQRTFQMSVSQALMTRYGVYCGKILDWWKTLLKNPVSNHHETAGKPLFGGAIAPVFERYGSLVWCEVATLVTRKAIDDSR